MSWFIYALICTLGWGAADLFYKLSSDADDRYSHLKIAVWVGLIMGSVSVGFLIFSGTAAYADLFTNGVKYLPASLSYIISMIIGYAGLRYLELSIISPVQNASGAFSMIGMLIFFMAAGKFSGIMDAFSLMDLMGTALICVGMIALAVAEKRIETSEGKGRITGALALIFPLLYCLFDTLGTAADGIILDGETGLGLSETDVLIIYGLTFFAAGVVSWIVLRIKTGSFYNPLRRSELPKAAASVFETAGQYFYVYAMASRPVVAAPMVAGYCMVSLLLARVFIKEKLRSSQYVCIFMVIAGIILLGISEGLS